MTSLPPNTEIELIYRTEQIVTGWQYALIIQGQVIRTLSCKSFQERDPALTEIWIKTQILYKLKSTL